MKAAIAACLMTVAGLVAAPALAATGHTMETPAAAPRASVSVADIQKVATKYGLQTKLQETSVGVPYLAVQRPTGETFAFIEGLGCKEDKTCQGFTIYSVVNDGALSATIVRKYNSDYSYTRLAQHESGLFFEQQSLASGGITDLNIANSLSVFFQNMKLLGELSASKMTELKPPSSTAMSAPAGGSPSASFSFAPLIGALPLDAKLFATGTKAEAAAAARAGERATAQGGRLDEIPSE